ncbi:hypothetical protein [Paenibacillus apii]|uniref:hypothetical protein n=1 Tax=Paenibacillus apii TaxID=1850370 RepID=UPI00143AA0CE|nr:hypothetical protein [Paenibacillus apii]NJJ41110.1 hypothetical protein [Paenibacillus apii]
MEQYSFIRINEAFPTEDLVGRWIIGLAVIHNDFLFLRKQLFMRTKDISEFVVEAPTSFKFLVASLREAIFYLEESQKHYEIKNYIELLPSSLLELHSRLTPLFRTGHKADLLQRLTNIRNITYHFSKPHRNEIVKALKEIQDQKIFYEDTENRFLYAEHIRNSIILNSLFDPEEIKLQDQQLLITGVLREIKEAFEVFIKFSREVNKLYLKDFL